jgi:O-antigen/teichoic acid export membrane protein
MTSTARAYHSLERGASWLTVSTVLVGAVNYCYAMSLTWLLPPQVYSVFASGQALLLLCATASCASVPWVIARGIAGNRDPEVERSLFAFAGQLACGQAIVAALTVALVASRFANGLGLLTIVLSTTAFFGSAISVGYLQGQERFERLAGLRIGEVILKVAVGIPLSLTAMGAAGALAGFTAGALVVMIGGMPFLRRDFRVHQRRSRYRGPWRDAAWLTALQAGVALFANLDILLASIMFGPSSELARYQASAIVGRVPLFLALSLGTVVFPRLSTARGSPASVVRTTSDFFVRTAVPVALMIATIPRELIDQVLPSEYAGLSELLPYTVASGIAISVMYLLVVAYQAEQRFRTGAALLGAVLAIHGGAVTIGLTVGGVEGIARGALAGSVGTAVLALVFSARIWPGGFRPRSVTVLGLAPALSLVAIDHYVPAWTVCAAITLAGTCWALLQPQLVGRTAPTIASGVEPSVRDAPDFP